MAEEIISHVSKITNGQKNLIIVPKKIAKHIDLENTYVKLTLMGDKTLKLIQCDSIGRPINQKPSSNESRMFQLQSKIQNKQLEMEKMLEKEFRDIQIDLTRIKEGQDNYPTSNIPFTHNIQEPEEPEEPEVLMIPIRDKTGIDYEYIFRYEVLDPELYHDVQGILDELETPLSNDEPRIIYGLNYVSAYHGVPCVRLDEPCDWEIPFKGKTDLPQADYYAPHLYTYKVDENGVEHRVPYEEIKKFEKEAVFEFISHDGKKKYQLEYDEIWFKPYELGPTGQSIERILSVENYLMFKKGFLDKHMTPEKIMTVEQLEDIKKEVRELSKKDT